MTEKNYLNLKSMQEKADTAFQEKVDRSWDRYNKEQEIAKQEQEELQGLFHKAIQLDHEAVEQKKAETIKNEKAKVIQEVESKFENQGVKSEHTKQLEQSYQGLLNGLNKNK